MGSHDNIIYLNVKPAVKRKKGLFVGQILRITEIILGYYFD